jgi:hypothetical protein
MKAASAPSGLLRWPGHVAANRVDETSVTGGVDFLPTICKLTQSSVPASVRPDGEDVSDIWLGHPRARTKPLFWEWLFHVQGDDYTPPMLAIRDGDWKLFVEHDGSHAQLFDIPKDIGESTTWRPGILTVVRSLTAKVLAWQKSLPPSRARDEATAKGKAVDTPHTSAIAPRLPAAMSGFFLSRLGALHQAIAADELAFALRIPW